MEALPGADGQVCLTIVSNAIATALSRRANVLLRYEMIVLPLAHCFFCFKKTNPCGKVDRVFIPHAEMLQQLSNLARPQCGRVAAELGS